MRDITMVEIKDAVAVITGGSMGIGKALAKYWVEQGGKALIAARREEPLKETKAELGDNIEYVTCDATSEDDCAKMADTAIEKFGKINLVAPFAGIIKDGMLVSPDRETGKIKRKMSLKDFQAVIDINLTGTFLAVRECTERMVNNDCKGLICLMSSVNAQGMPGQINYSSTKAAISVMCKVLTAEFFRRGLSQQLRCVTIAPGFVGTPMVKGMKQEALDKILSTIPIGRLIEPEEVASLVGELYRNEALAGDVFSINGGLRLGSKGM